MLISQKNLEDTCGYFVSSCRRECKENPCSALLICQQTRLKFTGLSILLVGHREKRFVERALEQISIIQNSYIGEVA